MQLTVRQPSASEDAKHYTTDRLRSEYLIETVFAPDDAILTYSHFDRIIAGGVMPVSKSVELVGCKELASDTFLQRREMGVINIGGKGKITVDGTVYDLKQYDGLYVGMGAKELSFTSDDPADPAKFYINTCLGSLCKKLFSDDEASDLCLMLFGTEEFMDLLKQLSARLFILIKYNYLQSSFCCLNCC